MTMVLAPGELLEGVPHEWRIATAQICSCVWCLWMGVQLVAATNMQHRSRSLEGGEAALGTNAVAVPSLSRSGLELTHGSGQQILVCSEPCNLLAACPG